MKCAALSRSALQPDASAHQLNQPSGDAQTQSGAAKAAGGRSVLLREGFKNMGLHVGSNADAGVTHSHMQQGFSAIDGIAAHHGIDPAFLGELDGIVQQVQQHLP